jgi:hypothetical protein
MLIERDFAGAVEVEPKTASGGILWRGVPFEVYGDQI